MAELDTTQGRVLITIARSSIEKALGRSAGDPHYEDEWLAQPGASFVTLERFGALRGCIGSLEARRPLREDVSENAFMAAFRDRRFDPVTSEELVGLTVKVSVLSPPELLEVRSETELLEVLRPGVDGLVLEHCGRRATFLPQVWRYFSEPREFLERLREKAGWPRDFWADGMRCHRYCVQSWSEDEP